ncbi:MAG: hypothetical protein IKK80_02345 [Treponema sp.]|nr:hypothetical protein [Treponema sp.]
MKKNFIKKIAKIFSVFAGCLLLASFSPSLDGRAVVVDEGVFPEGLFAKTVGYLPGDTISVTNVAGDTTVDLLVIGALDPSEGVAIMLSPEAAAEIGIEKDSNNIVKITKRSGQDERVFGTAVIAKSDELPKEDLVQEEVAEETDEYEYDVEYNPADFHEEYVEEEEVAEGTDEYEYDVEYNPADFHEEYVEEDEVEEETDEYEYDVEYNPADFHEEYVEEEEVEEETGEYEYDVEYNPADFHEEYVEDEEIEEEFIEAEELEDIVAEEDDEETLEDELIEEEIAAYEEEIESEEVSDEKIEDLPEEFDEEIIQEEFTEVDESIEEVAEDLVAEEEIPLEEEFVEADSLDELESLDEELEVVETDDEVELIEEATEEEYEAIVLVPVESNPPAVESTEEEIVEETIEPIVAPVVEKSVTVVPEPIILEPSKETETSTSYQKYLVPSLQDLESGKYYIQIASLRDDKNIEEIISKYANNYPITIVPKKAGNIKQILVGPLSMDEYGVVLQRFKSYGYKDAFLRKIK